MDARPSVGALTAITKLPAELENVLPAGRKEEKVKDSAWGIGIALIGVAVLVAVFVLALKGSPPLVLAGGAVLGAVVLAFGALTADKETIWPVLRGMVALAVSIIKARKAAP